jgi:hypothetical protein
VRRPWSLTGAHRSAAGVRRRCTARQTSLRCVEHLKLLAKNINTEGLGEKLTPVGEQMLRNLILPLAELRLNALELEAGLSLVVAVSLGRVVDLSRLIDDVRAPDKPAQRLIAADLVPALEDLAAGLGPLVVLDAVDLELGPGDKEAKRCQKGSWRGAGLDSRRDQVVAGKVCAHALEALAGDGAVGSDDLVVWR